MIAYLVDGGSVGRSDRGRVAKVEALGERMGMKTGRQQNKWG
jgi:hypothetical protein